MVDWLNRFFVLNEENFYQLIAHSVGSGGLSLFSVKKAKRDAPKWEEGNQDASNTWLNENVIKEDFSCIYNIKLPNQLPWLKLHSFL